MYLESINVDIMYLPAYYPDLNPSENVSSCIKHRLNNIRPRTTTGFHYSKKIIF